MIGYREPARKFVFCPICHKFHDMSYSHCNPIETYNGNMTYHRMYGKWSKKRIFRWVLYGLCFRIDVWRCISLLRINLGPPILVGQGLQEGRKGVFWQLWGHFSRNPDVQAKNWCRIRNQRPKISLKTLLLFMLPNVCWPVYNVYHYNLQAMENRN